MRPCIKQGAAQTWHKLRALETEKPQDGRLPKKNPGCQPRRSGLCFQNTLQINLNP